jgi:UDP-glucuronate 4-epimerase
MLMLTGGTGHVGGKIVERAAADGIDLLAVYRGDTPPSATPESSSVTWAQCDLADAQAVNELTERYGVTSCIHAAAVSNEAYARPDPLAAISTNIGSTAVLLDTARRQSWRRFILISTGSVFQKREINSVPIPEDALPEPENIYSTTKTAAEMLCRMYRTEFGLSASAVRISWVYGPPVVTQDATRGPIPSFVIRALRCEAIDEGGADFAAGFTYVEDVVSGLFAAVSAKKLKSEIYHLGHGRNFRLSEVADAIGAVLPEAAITLSPGTDPWTRYTALRDALGVEKMQADTGFRPQYSLAQGVAAFINWLRDNRELWTSEQTNS